MALPYLSQLYHGQPVEAHDLGLLFTTSMQVVEPSRFGSVSTCAEQHCGQLMSIDNCDPNSWLNDGEGAVRVNWDLLNHRGCYWARSKCDQPPTEFTSGEISIFNIIENGVNNDRACGAALAKCLSERCALQLPNKTEGAEGCTIDEDGQSGIYPAIPGSCPDGKECLKFLADSRVWVRVVRDGPRVGVVRDGGDWGGTRLAQEDRSF